MRRIMPLLAAVVIGGLIFWLGSMIDNAPMAQRNIPGSVYNTSVDGAAALERWLADLDYDVRRMEYVAWNFDEQDFDALLIIEPSQFFEPGEPQVVLDWVGRTGSTLIVIDDDENAIYRELEVSIADEVVDNEAESRMPLANPPVRSIRNPATPYLITRRPDAAVVLGTEEKPLALAINVDGGIVYLVSSAAVANNRGLRDERNARLIQNLLSQVPAEGRIAFDEIHHGRALPPARPRNPVVFSPLVAALIYSAMVIGLWAFLNGRRFGTIVPTRLELSRRSSAEYVQSMASLFQRGRQTGHILSHYKTAFKRRLAKPYGFNPRLADADYVRELGRFVAFDEARLAALLNALSNPNPSEESLLRMVNAADNFAEWFEGQR